MLVLFNKQHLYWGPVVGIYLLRTILMSCRSQSAKNMMAMVQPQNYLMEVIVLLCSDTAPQITTQCVQTSSRTLNSASRGQIHTSTIWFIQTIYENPTSQKTLHLHYKDYNEMMPIR